MKLFLVLLLVSVSGMVVTAQAPSGPSNSGGIAVLNKKWAYEVRNPSLDQDPIQDTADRQEAERQRIDIERRNEMLRARGMPTLPVPPPLPPPRTDTLSPKPGPTVTYIYQVNLRNNSPKEVKTVMWEYVFAAADTGKELGRRRFISHAVIRPGKSTNLTLRSPSPPTGSIDASAVELKAGKLAEKIIILSIEFADGSKWPG